MASELLKGLRMLDLADDKGALCGKIFADMGAEVIKVEPREGCATRRIPPFLDDVSGLDSSTYFLAYAAGKKSITANLEHAEGRELFLELIKRSDFLVESFRLGHLESIGLGHATLAEFNPRLIHATITPFGDSGPARDYKTADIVSWASGGPMFLMGEPERPPLEMSQPQAGLHAGGEAAVASMIAHYARGSDGLGQHIIVDMQACAVWTMMNEQAMPLLHGDYLRRSGIFTGAIGGRRKTIFKCADGHISFLLAGGAYLPSTKAVIAWMKEEGAAPEWLTREGGLKSLTPSGFMSANPKDFEELEQAENLVEQFFMPKTKQEIWANILKWRLLAAPINNVADIAADPQLRNREYFVEIEHRGSGRKLTLPGPFAKLSKTPIGPAGSAPQLGEHNREIYCDLLGHSAEELAQLRAAKAI
jgi:crotonobetainyl-CoA:carnitine CoA-transferase CaiB-like acyl-CoA transferase